MVQQKFLFILLALLGFSLPSLAQKITVHVFMEDYKSSPSSDTIYYDFKRPLTWADFRGKVPPGVPWGAMTASGFSYKSSASIDEDHIDITVGVYTFFTKSKSWKKPSTHSAYHLQHEQHHFDITRLGTAKVANEIRKAHFTKSNYKTLINSIFDKVYEEQIALQNQYDRETKNSMDTAKQLEWNRKITAEMQKLKTDAGGNISLKM